MKRSSEMKIIGLLIISMLFASQSLSVWASDKKNPVIDDKDLSIRQIIAKYYSDSYFGR